jgi:hypothetical protein
MIVDIDLISIGRFFRLYVRYRTLYGEKAAYIDY